MKIYTVPEDIAPRFRRLVVFCRWLGFLLRTGPVEDVLGFQHDWGWTRLVGTRRRLITVQPDKIEADLDWGLVAFAHEISHCLIGVSFDGRFKRKEPFGFLQIPVEMLVWVLGYVTILLVAREYLSITTYIRFAGEGMGSYVRFYRKR